MDSGDTVLHKKKNLKSVVGDSILLVKAEILQRTQIIIIQIIVAIIFIVTHVGLDWFGSCRDWGCHS